MARTATFNKQEMLEKVMHLFWEKGYNGTSLQDLVNTTGLNRSSLYNTYGNKMKLYRMALDNYMQHSSGQLNASLKIEASGYTLIQNLFFSFLPEIMTDSRGCMNVNCRTEMSSDADLKTWLIDSQAQFLKLFENLVQKGQSDGSINQHQNAVDYAWHLLNTLHGFRITGILEKDEKTLKSIINNSLKILE